MPFDLMCGPSDNAANRQQQRSSPLILPLDLPNVPLDLPINNDLVLQPNDIPLDLTARNDGFGNL